MPGLGADSLEPRKREEEAAMGFLWPQGRAGQGRAHAALPVTPQSASGQAYRAAGQLTCASLQ